MSRVWVHGWLGALSATLILAAGGLAGAHVIPLDVTLTRYSGGVQALILSPDGVNVSGVRLSYGLNAGPLVPFTEASPGVYRAADQPRKPGSQPVTLKLVDRTFPSEESQVSVQSVWPPTMAVQARVPARPLTGGTLTLTPAVLLPVLLAVLIVGGVGLALRRSTRGGSPL